MTEETMKSRTLICITAMTLFAAPAIPLRLAAQDGQNQQPKHHHYKLIDVGTLGGPNSYLPLLPPYHSFVPSESLSRGGIFAGFAETATPDPYAPFCFNADCFASHAVAWRDGTLTDLGALPGPAGSSSAATWISKNGLIAGVSENGEVDPLVGIPVSEGVLWKNGNIINLGTLEGGYQSQAMAVNNSGQVVGLASNLVPDPNSLLGTTTQWRAFLWENGAMQDLGTLPGGTDAMALFVNERGQIVGQSYAADSIVPPPSGTCVDSPLTLHSFFWDKGRMTDLGTFGGSCAFPYALNNRGQVVGQANLAGDSTSHPFLWQSGKMTDLGALGGTYGFAEWLNDAGTVVGSASNQGDQALLAFLWEKGTITNLGALPGNACSAADAINSAGQIVGGSGFNAAQSFPACTDPVEHAVLWDNGQLVDLNNLVPAGTDLTLTEAFFINDRGEISGFGTLSDGDQHAFLLIPCGPDDIEACQEVGQDVNASQSTPAPIASRATTATQPNLTARGIATGSRARLFPRYRSPAVVAPATPHNLTASAQNTYQIKLNWQEASGQNQSGFNIYRCHGCSNPQTQGTKIASVGASVFTYTDGSSTKPLTESTTYAYQVTAFNGGGESGPSNVASAATKTEPAPTNLASSAFRRGFYDIVRLGWTNNSSDDDSYHIERCAGATCTNFSERAQTGANAITYTDYFQFANGRTFRYRVRAHSPGGYSGYSNIRTQTLP
jgi:probable HAF family extracellular repeat protein